MFDKPVFDLLHVRDSFTHAAFYKAKDLLNRSKVLMCHVQNGCPTPVGDMRTDIGYYYTIISRVKGTAEHPYQQDIKLKFYDIGEGSWVLSGNCSCPVGRQCKHVAAAVMFAKQAGMLDENSAQSSVFEKNAMSDWLTNLSRAADMEKNYSQIHRRMSAYTSDKSLFYVLDSATIGWKVSIYKSKFNKSGAMSKTQIRVALDVKNLLQESYVDDKDALILPLLEVSSYTSPTRNLNMSFGYQRTSLGGKFGAEAVLAMLAAGRMYLHNLDGAPLRLGEARQLQQGWEFDHQGNQYPRLCAQAQVQAVLPTEPVLAIDAQLGEVFELLGADCAKACELDIFCQAPVVPAAMSAQAAKQLAAFKGAPLPALEKVAVVAEPRRVNTTMVLQLHGDFQAPGLLHHKANATLHFAYAVFEKDLQENLPEDLHEDLQKDLPEDAKEDLRISEFLADDAEISYYHSGQLHRYQRDVATETAAKQKLDSFGLCRYEATGYEARNSPAVQTRVFDTVMQWQVFLSNVVPQLERAGWLIEAAPEMQIEGVDVADDDWYADVESEHNNHWFDLQLGVQLEGKNINLLPVLLQAMRGQKLDDVIAAARADAEYFLPVALDDGRFLNLPGQRLIPLLEVFIELFDRDTSLDERGNLRLQTTDAVRLNHISGTQWLWNGGESLRAFADKLADFKKIKVVKPPSTFKAQLRDYQQEGLNWLQFLREYNLAGILADDMGLGKTVQALAHLSCEADSKRLSKPCLIIVPTSLVSNWKNEAQRFAPNLSVLTLHGDERKSRFAHIPHYDIVLSTYPLLRFDDAELAAYEYSFLILDEAQKIKNHKSVAAKWVRSCRAEHRICLTGTPMENHLGELWAQFDFLMPGLLGDERQFKRLYRTPIEKNGDSARQQSLGKRIAPFMLRRKKETVATELPEKNNIIRTVELSGKQRDLYETVRLAMDKKLRDEIAKKGMARSQIMILDALLKLRQVCCHPGIMKLAAAQSVQQSAKLEMLMEMLPEMVEEGRKVLIFSQFTTMLSVIESELVREKISYVKLTGQTKDRITPVDSFQAGEVDVFIISLKAGGSGLNLTAADTVIHYDPWWNPAVEDQATDRAHRIGQDKPVFVYKLTTENTVEEKILEMQARKRALADSTYGKPSKNSAAFTKNDLDVLFEPL